MRTRRSRTVFETASPLSGRIRVIDDRRERRLVVGGEILSLRPLDGDWRAVRREYWWHAVVGVRLHPRPRALLVGLGGGTQVHLLHQHATPRLVTVIERDPAIVRVALDWFGVGDAGPLEIVCGEAREAARGLARLGRRFDYVMEDAAYGEDAADAVPLARALVPLVAPAGALVVNRHRRRAAGAVAEALAADFAQVRLRRVRREGENVLVCCEEPLRPPSGPDSA